MDPFLGFEVGAEVELNDGCSVLEEAAVVTVENKQDLPAWHHLHYIDESSSDESLDPQHMLSTSLEMKNMDAPKYKPHIKTQSELERKVFTTSEGPSKDPPLPDLEKEDLSVAWSQEYTCYDEQTFPVGLDIEETEISHLEIVPASSYSLSPTLPSELYSEIMLPQERGEAELSGQFSFYNARTQCAGTVKPWERSHRCTKCGRQFGRRYNLESHMCIKTALTRVNIGDIMTANMADIRNPHGKYEQSEESMNRLEKMCAEAQKELQNLQELYKKDDDKSLLSITLPKSTQVDGPVPSKVPKYKRPFMCFRCGRRFRREFNLGFHVCSSNQNMSASQNTITIKPINPRALDIHQSDPAISGQDLPPKSQSADHTKGGKLFKCQYCGKVYNRRASYGSHMRWHMKEKDLVASVNKSLATGDLRSLLTNIHLTAVGLKKRAGPTFTCQECGRVFNKQCSYSTHILWHSKSKNPGCAAALPSISQHLETQEGSIGLAQVPSITDKQGTKAVPENTYNCQECGRVFFKKTAYANHSRWHKKERDFELSVKATTQSKTIGHQLQSSSMVNSSNNLPDPSFRVDHLQGYGNPVKNLSEGTENRAETLNNMMDPDQQRILPEVPEFVFELVVGTESFCDDKSCEVLEYSEESTSQTQTGSLNTITKEHKERSVPRCLVSPCKLLRPLLARPRPLHRCRDCGTCFSQSWKLKIHQHKSEPWRSRTKKYRCGCGRSPMGLLHFLRHQLQHLRDIAFICAVCGKVLRGHQQLRAHSWVHPLVSQFDCECGRRFTQLPRYLWHSLLSRKRRRPQQKRHPEIR